MDWPVPKLPPTVTAVASVCADTAELLRYCTLVSDAHASVLASASKACMLAVGTALPKFKPVTVTDAMPLSAVFAPPDETTGPTSSKHVSLQRCWATRGQNGAHHQN